MLETKKDESLKNRPKKIEQAKERWPGLAWLRERLAVGFGASSEIIMAPSFMACFLCCCFVPCVSFRSSLSTTNHNLNVFQSEARSRAMGCEWVFFCCCPGVFFHSLICASGNWGFFLPSLLEDVTVHWFRGREG